MSTAKSWVVFIIVMLVEILLALSPFIPGLKDILKSALQTADPLEITVSLTGIYAVLVTLFLGAGYASIRESLLRTQTGIENSLTAKSAVKVLRDDEFHDDFLIACRRANSHVCITNLSPKPIYFDASEERKRYLLDLVREIQNKPRVQFRRLMRETSDNLDLAEDLLSKLQGVTNSHIALLSDSGKEDNPLALSVQIVDDHDSWLVALSSHERQSSYRDVHVHDKIFTQALHKYYERLWDRGTVILDSGVVTERGNQLVNSRAKRKR